MISSKINKIKKSILISIIFGLFGIYVEVLFTAFSTVFTDEGINWSLEGKTYVWMFFIYALIKPLFDLAYHKISKLNVLIRIFIYSIIILLIEFVSGFILESIIGICPWKYSNGLTFQGYIRLDYIFFWMLFGYIIEYLYLFLENVITFDSYKTHKITNGQ